MYKVMVVITLILLGSTLICGFWLRYSGQKVEPSALNFHMTIAMLTALSVVVTLLLKRS